MFYKIKRQNSRTRNFGTRGDMRRESSTSYEV